MDRDVDVPGMLAPQRVVIGIMGPVFVGYQVELFLTGICFASLYHYTVQGHLSRDKWKLKSVALLVFLMNTALAIFCVVSTFDWGTSQKRTIDDLETFKPIDCVQPALGGMVGFLTQGYFCRRAALLFESKARKWMFVVGVFLTMCGGLAGSIGSSYYDFRYMFEDGSIDYSFQWKVTQELWLWCSTAVDVVNTGVLCYLLQTKVVGFNERTDNTLRKLMRLAVETGSYTAAVSLGAALQECLTNNDSYYVGDVGYAFWVPLPALYCLSFFTTLTSRDKLAKDLQSRVPTRDLKPLPPTLSHLTARSPMVFSRSFERSRPASWVVDPLPAIDVIDVDLEAAMDEKQSPPPLLGTEEKEKVSDV